MSLHSLPLFPNRDCPILTAHRQPFAIGTSRNLIDGLCREFWSSFDRLADNKSALRLTINSGSNMGCHTNGMIVMVRGDQLVAGQYDSENY